MQKYLYNLATGTHKGPVAGLIKVLLFLLSCIYGLLTKILFFIYHLKPHHLKCKVISVGNITLGGTGKTVLVEYIARYLKRQGHKVAILTRGYKRRVTKVTEVTKVTGIEIMGDEPYMLASKLKDIPIVVDANRIRGARGAIKDYAVDTVILDDGFQQWKIKKDLEIVTVDATHPFGNCHLVPRGILREPLSSLKRADICVLTKINLNPDTQDLKDFLSSSNPKAAIFETMHKPVGFYELGNPDKMLGPETLENKTVTLFSGIADPDSFENLIINLGINIGIHFRFPDHYNYSQKDLDKIIRASKERDIDTLVTTEKDSVRLCDMRQVCLPARQATCDMRLLVFCIKLEINNEQELHNRLLRLYSI